MRNHSFKFSIALLCGTAVCGCDRKQAKPPAVVSQTQGRSEMREEIVRATPATEPTTTHSSGSAVSGGSANAATVASGIALSGEPSTMVIDQKRVGFPPSRLRLQEKDGHVLATLFSDDPKEAIDDKYAGNSFYFEMTLDAEKIKDFATATWRLSASPTDTEDTPYGIFLDGHKRQLQPIEVKVDFEQVNDEVTIVWMSGRFMLIDLTDDGTKQPPQETSLAAKLVAKTAVK